jgi:hypothetical protein
VLLAAQRLVRAAHVAVQRRASHHSSRFRTFAAAVRGGPVGPPGQYGTRVSKVRTGLDPVWNQWLELRLQGGAIGRDGNYANEQVPYSAVRLEVWDRDRFSRDDFIGEVSVPLGPLIDQRRHHYTLPLVDPEKRCNAKGGVCGHIMFELRLDS